MIVSVCMDVMARVTARKANHGYGVWLPDHKDGMASKRETRVERERENGIVARQRVHDAVAIRG